MKSRLSSAASLAPTPWLGEPCLFHWIQILKNDALRLQHFEKNDLILVIGAIRSVPEETSRVAGPRVPGPNHLAPLQ
jgi:hypothetical protein